MTKKVLIVDDDPNLLASIVREVGDKFALTTAKGPEEGLLRLEQEGPFAIVVADMRMPGMTGVQFLAEVREKYPNTVRMMLTGNADLRTAISAVNEGNIFRFLTKPTPPEVLWSALDAGIRQYELIYAEKDLLEKTLVGSISMLAEALSVINPLAFSRAIRLRRTMVHLVRELHLEDSWRYEVAAALSQLGWITFPGDLLQKISDHEPLSREEKNMFNKHPSVGRFFLERIPRLELIGKMVGDQLTPLSELDLEEKMGEEYEAAFGAHLLKSIIDYDQIITAGKSHLAAMNFMEKQTNEYLPEILQALYTFEQDLDAGSYQEIRINELDVGMILAEDIHSDTGDLIAKKGDTVSYPILMQLFKHTTLSPDMKNKFKVYTY